MADPKTVSDSDKLNQILDLLSPKDLSVAELKEYNPGIDWKSVFISGALTILLFAGFYSLKLKDLATRQYVNQEINYTRDRNWSEHCRVNEKISNLEIDVKKLKERRIGSVGNVGDAGPK